MSGRISAPSPNTPATENTVGATRLRLFRRSSAHHRLHPCRRTERRRSSRRRRRARQFQPAAAVLSRRPSGVPDGPGGTRGPLRLGLDANDNPTQFTLPSGAAHTFSYTSADLESTYAPPAGSPVTRSYNAARDLTGISQPDGRAETLAFDGSGRPTGLSIPEASTSLTYPDATDRVPSLQTRTEPGPGWAIERSEHDL